MDNFDIAMHEQIITFLFLLQVDILLFSPNLMEILVFELEIIGPMPILKKRKLITK